jgi:hypothetical protein
LARTLGWEVDLRVPHVVSLGLTVGVLLLLSACQGDQTAGGAAPTSGASATQVVSTPAQGAASSGTQQTVQIHACDLMTQQDLQTVMKVSFPPGQESTLSQSQQANSNCAYMLPNVASAKISANGGDTAGLFAGLQSSIGKTTPVSGLGEAAFESSIGAVFFLKKGFRVSVAVEQPVLNLDQTFAIAHQLAVLAAGRL